MELSWDTNGIRTSSSSFGCASGKGHVKKKSNDRDIRHARLQQPYFSLCGQTTETEMIPTDPKRLWFNHLSELIRNHPLVQLADLLVLQVRLWFSIL